MKIISGIDTDPKALKKNILALLEKGEVREYYIDSLRKIDVSTMEDETPQYIPSKIIQVCMYLKVDDEEYLKKLFE